MKSFLLRWLYSFLFGFFTILCLPYYFIKLKRRGNPFDGIDQRLGLYPKREVNSEQGVDLWIHGVSVGEVMIGKVILKELWKIDPKIKVAFSTTTATGFRLAASEPKEKCFVFYFPLDFPWAVRRTFSYLHPKLVVLIETEIWPNFLAEASERKIPVLLCNARLSERTERWYKIFSWFMKPYLHQLSLILVTDDSEIERFVKVGFPPERIFRLGSMKFDVANYRSHTEVSLGWWTKVGWDAKNLVVLGGSTHRGEEDILLREFIKLRKHWPNLRLILAPRHAERAKEIKNLCDQFGLNSRLRSSLEKEMAPEGNFDILIVDSTGELRSLYEKADLVFVGKSLTAKGGQNFIEAAKAGKAIIVGPNMQNFKLLLNLFVDQRAIVMVQNKEEFSHHLKSLIAEEKTRKLLGERAKSLFLQNVGVGEKTAKILHGYLNFQQQQRQNFGEDRELKIQKSHVN